MVRILITLVIASIVGVLFGNLQTKWSTEGITEQFQLVQPTGEPTPGGSGTTSSVGLPKAELPDGNTFEFEQMRYGSSMSHSFKVRNAGTGVLRLTVGGSTCKCTVGELSKGSLEPGEETEINLTWRGPAVSVNFGQTATVNTNDPETPELKFQISGSVIDSFVFEPADIELGDFGPDVPIHKEFMVYCYADEDFELARMQWTHAATEKFVKLEYEEVPIDSESKHSQASRTYQCKLDIRAGMPIGLVTSSISFLTNHAEVVDPLEMKVHGRVTSDLTLLGGSYFMADRNIMDIGHVSPDESFTTSLWIALRGDERKGFEATVEQLDAIDSLEVKVGEPKSESNRTLVPIQFTVPKGAKKAYYPGNTKGNYARVLLRSNSSKLTEMTIRVILVVDE